MARMTKKKALWWLESLSRNYGGSLHKQAVEVIRAELAEARPTVRRKPPVQHRQPEICPDCHGKGVIRKYIPDGEWDTCDTCNGTGKLRAALNHLIGAAFKGSSI